MKWEPIETAPKDGTSVLLYGYWQGEIHGLSKSKTIDIGYWSGGSSDMLGNDWWTLSTGDAYACWMRPSHWCKLPKVPE